MRLFSAFILTILLGLCSSNSPAQTNWCGTDEAHLNLLNHDPQLLLKAKKEQNRIFQIARNLGHQKMNNLITMPVVVHIIHDNGVGNISDAQVRDGIRVLNEDFQRLNSDTNLTRSVFKPFAADIEIQFKLARIDNNGNCTNGIVRVNSELTRNARNNVKSLSYWPSNKYLNIWLVESIQSFSSGGGITLGYAQFPFAGINSTYGIVQRSDQWGAIENSNSDGRTATHEVGHCLALFHTFQSGCGSSCASSGDGICDTPPVREQTFSCSTTQNTCSNDVSGIGSAYSTNVVDQIENYMSYDACQNMFTLEQRDVMQSVFTSISGLANLVSQANLVATGTDSNYVPQDCAPIAEFIYPNNVLCEGMNVTYTDISYNGAIVTRAWSFPGGTPSSSSDSIVNVTYSGVGVYNASLTVSNAVGSDSQSHNDVVEVKPALASFTSWFYSEGLETSSFADNWDVINNTGNREWEITSDAAFTGDNSLYINNFSGNTIGNVDEFISPSFDLSAVVEPTLTFKVAYTTRTATNDDNLRIFYSVNCGQTWVLRFARFGTRLESVDSQNTPFVPAGPDEWDEITVTLPATAKESSNVLFKFEFTAGGGNNIYIDDINIQNPTGINEIPELAASLQVYPNPTTGLSTLVFDTDESINNADIFITDIRGRKVLDVSGQKEFTKGTHQMQINADELPSGLYFIRFTSNKGQLTQKLIVE